MNAILDSSLHYIFAAASLSYIWIAILVGRSSPARQGLPISYFLLLIGIWLAGAAFEYHAATPLEYGIGRTLTFASAGFIPVVLFAYYLDFFETRQKYWVIAVLSIVPVITLLLAITNSAHHLIWAAVESADGSVRFTRASEHAWFNLIHAPYAYVLFLLSIMGITSRLPAIATAHRKQVVILLVCILIPFAVSLGDTLLQVGQEDFPNTSCAFALLLPFYAWATIGLKVYEFNPLAYRTMFDKVRDPIIVLDKNKRIVSANKPAQELLGQSEDSLIGKDLWEDYPEARELLGNFDGDMMRQTVRMRNGRFFELQGAPLDDKEGMILVCRDVTERKNAQRALADSEHLIRSLVENSSNGILRFSRDDKDSRKEFCCTYANNAAETFLEWGEGNLIGMMLSQLDLLNPDSLIDHFSSATPRNSSLSYEIQLGHGAEEFWLRVVAEPVGADFSVTLIDITARKSVENKILDDAQRDPLTGILNRRGFEMTASKLVGEELVGAVIYIDLDQFKSVNDRFGHQAGDALLKAFVHRLEFCLRPEDVLARLGGDEFAIMLPGIDVADASHVARRLSEAAAEPYLLHAQEIICSASIGIAMMPADASDLWALIAAADQSMYAVKANTRDVAANEKNWDEAAS